MSDFETEMLKEVVIEASEHLAEIEPDLLKLEQESGGAEDTINRLFRSMHSIKGSFGFFDMTQITRLAHDLESVLMGVRDGKQDITTELVDVLLKGVDKVSVMVKDVQHSQETSIDDELLLLSPFLLPEGGRSLPHLLSLPAQKRKKKQKRKKQT